VAASLITQGALLKFCEILMSNPTQPDDTNQDAPADNNETAQANQEAANMDHATPNDPLKAQAYVDPSIAAEAQLAGMEAEIAGLKDKFIRAHAEMDNLRKRTEREKADTSKYAISRFAGDVLAVADNLQRALAAFGEAGSEPDPQTTALIEGVELTESELSKALERHGVRKIESLGTIFDPNFHQAVMEEENKELAAGTVLRVFQEGYQIGERVLRPSMVVVARGGARPTKPTADTSSPAGPTANYDVPPPSDTDPAGRQ
jgi:molecular chaperone GrpE